MLRTWFTTSPTFRTMLQSQEDKAAEKQEKENDAESEPPKGKRGKKGGGGRKGQSTRFMSEIRTDQTHFQLPSK